MPYNIVGISQYVSVYQFNIIDTTVLNKERKLYVLYIIAEQVCN